MKSRIELEKLYKEAKGEHRHYEFERFEKDCKGFLEYVKKGEVILSCIPSKSGMSRTMNFSKYNIVMNICYNKKFKWDRVRIGGCGMDMIWHVMFVTCEYLLTKKEIEKPIKKGTWHTSWNSLCSSYKIL